MAPSTRSSTPSTTCRRGTLRGTSLWTTRSTPSPPARTPRRCAISTWRPPMAGTYSVWARATISTGPPCGRSSAPSTGPCRKARGCAAWILSSSPWRAGRRWTARGMCTTSPGMRPTQDWWTRGIWRGLPLKNALKQRAGGRITSSSPRTGSGWRALRPMARTGTRPCRGAARCSRSTSWRSTTGGGLAMGWWAPPLRCCLAMPGRPSGCWRATSGPSASTSAMASALTARRRSSCWARPLWSWEWYISVKKL